MKNKEEEKQTFNYIDSMFPERNGMYEVTKGDILKDEKILSRIIRLNSVEFFANAIS